MRNLLRFILKNNFYFLFAALQFLAIYLLYLSHSYRGSVLWNSSRNLAGRYYKLRTDWIHYFLLDDINRSITRSFLQKLRCVPSSPVFPASEEKKNLFDYSTAEVVDETRQYQNNYLIITGGKNHGIEKDMGVFSPTGIVGMVTDVSDHYALVMSVLHSRFKVNCEIKKNGIYGMLQWDGKSPYYAELTDLPNHTRTQQGDTVVTGKLSGIFPPGILVGTIETIERKQNDPFLTAHIRLSTEWGKLHEVFVVKNIHKTELDSLRNKSFLQTNKKE